MKTIVIKRPPNAALPGAIYFSQLLLSDDDHRSPNKSVGGPNEDAYKRIRRLRYRILVVDDNDPFRLSVMDLLKKRYRATVEEAEGPDVALDMLKDGSFDIILMDVRMPKMTGFQTYEELRARGIGAPVIFMSANDDADTGGNARALGEPFLKKPIVFEELDEIILRLAGM